MAVTSTPGTYTPASKSIVSSTNATPIVVTATAHGFSNGDIVYIVGHTTNTAANGTWVVASAATDTFALTSSVGNGVGGATGTILKNAETQVADTNAAGVYAFQFDMNALADGDNLTVRVYQMTLTSGTARIEDEVTYYGSQPTGAKAKAWGPYSNELTDSTSLRFSFQQNHGVARAIPWKVQKHA